jgi:hypothetical protein
MRGAVTAALLLLGGCLAQTAWAQEPAKPVEIVRPHRDRFLGLDVFAGAARFEGSEQAGSEDPSEKIVVEKTGWDVGATVSIGVRWLGITGAFGRQTIETVPTYQMAVGPRLTSPWLPLGELPVRGFAHALVGFAGTTGVTPSQSSAEWVVGGGFDFFLFRIQVDNVRLQLNGLKPSYFRLFFGGVVPLCLRACRESDGFNVSGGPAAK